MNTGTFPADVNLESESFDVVCFSHLRWDFVYQRPQHLLSRFAKRQRVFVIEEPTFTEGPETFDVSERADNLFIAVPKIAHGTRPEEIEKIQKRMLDGLMNERKIVDFISWYYTPMMLGWSDHLEPRAVIYDCMDELSMFKNPPAELREREVQLFSRADLVFTGGRSLYESKREQHKAVYCFPSSIDKAHFAQALEITTDTPDQESIGRPRIGFFGVIDERTDIELLREIAGKRPDWQFVMIGPVVKIDENDLPRGSNIHYLGGKSYDELPGYIAGWDVAMMPFAMNDSTRFISPTKTPEYLAAGRPVVSTPIRDVVTPYGEEGLVYIAETADEFVDAIERALSDDPAVRMKKAEEFLENISWDNTFGSMRELIVDVVRPKEEKTATAIV